MHILLQGYVKVIPETVFLVMNLHDVTERISLTWSSLTHNSGFVSPFSLVVQTFCLGWTANQFPLSLFEGKVVLKGEELKRFNSNRMSRLPWRDPNADFGNRLKLKRAFY